jgi:hypothetical protein
MVTVGWDNPLHTFFAQVMRPACAAAEDERVAWVGTEPQEIATVAQLCTHLRPSVAIPVAMQAQLTRDQASSLPPSALQARLVQLLAQLEQETVA